MANLYNRGTKSVEQNIAESEVQEKILSGGYEFLDGPNQKVWLTDPGGSPMAVRAAKAAKYIRQGQGTYASPLDVEKFKDNEAFANSTLGGFAAPALGLDDWLFAGMGSHAAEAAGFMDEGSSEAIENANPWLWNSLGVPASVVAGFFSGGTATTARGAAGAVQAARYAQVLGQHTGVRTAASLIAQNQARRAAIQANADGIVKNGFNTLGSFLGNYTLPGVSAKIGNKIIPGSTEAFAKMGSKFVPYRIGNTQLAQRFGPAAAKVMGATAGTLVEGGVWGAGEGISEALVGEPGESAEHILNSIGTNALIGAAFGGAVSSAIPILTGMKGVAGTIFDKVADLGGWAGGKTLDAAGDSLVKLAVENLGLSPAAGKRLKELYTKGDIGEEAMMDMRKLIDNVEGHSLDVAQMLDGLLLSDDILQIADMGGFSRDFLKILAENTSMNRVLRSIDFRALESDGTYKKLRQEIDTLDDRIATTISDAEKDVLATRKAKIVSKLNARKREFVDSRVDTKTTAETTEAQLFGEEGRPIKLPTTSQEVLRNTEQPFQRLREDIVQLYKRYSNLDARPGGPNEVYRGGLNQIVHDLNMRELRLYRTLFDEQVVKAMDQSRRANQPTFKERARAEISEKKNNARVQKWMNHWQSKLDDESKFNEMLEWFTKASDKKRGGEISIDPADQLRAALEVAAETSDVTDLLALAKRVGLTNTQKILRGSGTKSFDQIKRITQQVRSFSMEDDTHRLWTEKIEAVRGGIDDLVAKYDKMGVRGIDQIWEADRVGSYLDDLSPQRKRTPSPPAGAPWAEEMASLDDIGMQLTWRQYLTDLLEELGPTKLNTDVVVEAWKTMEDMQTRLLKESQRGFIGDHPAIAEDIKAAIDQLRREMKNPEKWGRLAEHKDRFDRVRKDFEKLRTQVLSKFTSGTGLAQAADAKKLQAYINNLDKDTSHIDDLRLSGYAKRAAEALDIIKTEFEPVNLLDIPKESRGQLSQKMANVNQLGLSQSKIKFSGPREEWATRIDGLKEFIGDADGRLVSKLTELKEDLPIAVALMGDQARAANMNQTLREVGRGGMIGAFGYLLSGMPRLGLAAGLMTGAAGVAQNPRALTALIHQLRSARKASKAIISDYMESWAENQVPKMAIERGWERGSKQAFLVAAQVTRRDKKEGRTKIRAKAMKSRAVSSWSDRIGIALSAEITPESFVEARESIEQLMKSPLVMDAFLREVTGPFSGAPDIQTAMKALIRSHVRIAARAIPRVTQATIFGEEYPPTPQQLREFQEVLQVLTDPTDTILTGMLTGTVTKKMIQTLAEAWPEVYSDISMEAMNIVGDDKKLKKLSQTQQQTLSMLLGLNYANPSELSRLQNPPVDEKKQAGGPRGGGQVAGIGERQQVGTSDSILYRAAV